MEEVTGNLVSFPDESPRDVLTDVLREGARKMLATAIEIEAQAFVESRQHLVDGNGRRFVVRNGHLPGRTIQTPPGLC